MISNISKSLPKSLQVTRERMLVLLETGLETKAYRFTRQAALSWLTYFPGDLEVNLYYAKALMKEERFSHAAPVIQKILHVDPEYIEAAILAESIHSRNDVSLLPMVTGMIKALGGSPVNTAKIPDWAETLYEIRKAIANNQFETARELIFRILTSTEQVELASLCHLQVTEKLNDRVTFKNLLQLYHARWPDCIQISLMLAKTWLESGEEDEAVQLMHYCAASDPTAQVPKRMWGSNFTFRPLYPQEMRINFDLPIPAEVAGRLGLNQIGAGVAGVEPPYGPESNRTDAASFDGFRVIPTSEEEYPQHPKLTAEFHKKVDPIVKEVESKFKQVAHGISQPVLTHVDERFPAHVILSMKAGLEKKFGLQSSQVIIGEMKKIAQTVQKRDGWTSFVFLPDDLEICGKYNITPVDALDPWKIKLALVDLDKALEKTGERIGSVMIVGDDGVVPFHRLPNPTDDADSDVPSDSPYGSLDTNYFISDWPVGRLPGESNNDSGLLITQLRNVARYHSEEGETNSWISTIIRYLFFWNHPWVMNFNNIGYSASVWKRSSLAAFQPIGEGRNMYLSPKGRSAKFDPRKLSLAPIGYFNLHGVEDGSDWYGQKDPLESESGPDFPVALRPADISGMNNIPRIVFCEACYGGHIFNKNENGSIALTMLGKGVVALIGSTTVSYGSVTTPLIGADLIGYLVMKNLRGGMSIGAAMSMAKVEFVREMNRRQGYLDGEDQKTLISFVLYGDPLVAYDPYRAMRKVVPRDLNHPVIKTIDDCQPVGEQGEQFDSKMISQAKNLVRGYLPSIDYAEARVKNKKIQVNRVNGFGKGQENLLNHQSEWVVVSFDKQVTQSEKTHHQYARVTLDKEGKMVKLAVSR